MFELSEKPSVSQSQSYANQLNFSTLSNLGEVPRTMNDKRRGLKARIAWSLSYFTLLLVIAPAILIVGHVVLQALPHFQFSVLTTNTTGLGGGLKNEIAGTLVIVVGVLVIAGGLGILSGIYLSNYARSKVGNFLRSSSEVLAGIPSIVFGYVGYIALVVHFHWGFSLGAGLVTLSLMVVPYVSKTTEVALRQVPSGYSEGGEALGLSEGYILRRITLKSALPGVVTGIIVAVAIATGETAPLLYTAGYSQNLPKLAVTHSPLGYLTYAVWTFYNQPSKAAVQLSYDAAFLLILGVVLLIVISRIVVSASQKHSENR